MINRHQVVMIPLRIEEKKKNLWKIIEKLKLKMIKNIRS